MYDWAAAFLAEALAATAVVGWVRRCGGVGVGGGIVGGSGGGNGVVGVGRRNGSRGGIWRLFCRFGLI